LLRLVIVVDVPLTEGCVVQVESSVEVWMAYDVTARPPLSAGADHVTVSELSPAVVAGVCGAAGTASTRGANVVALVAGVPTPRTFTGVIRTR
jgi:hypothetical protein